VGAVMIYAEANQGEPMKIEKQVCSLELAEKLERLGVEQKSLYYWVPNMEGSGHPSSPFELKEWFFLIDRETRLRRSNPFGLSCSAFTVAELGEMLPEGAYSLKSPSTKLFMCSWQVGGEEHRKPHQMKRLCFEAKTEADARAEMLIWLIENDLRI
jgi:hypothetical protein